MGTFGRRVRTAPHRTPEHTTSGALAAAARSLGVLLLVLLSSAIFYRQLTDRSWLETSPWDLTPGTAYDIGAFEAPERCAPVRWTRGDYIARACVVGHAFAAPERFGLVEPPDTRHPPLRYHWIDSGPDALLVACPMGAACEVLRVAEQRFSHRGIAPARTPAAQAAARRTPLSYRIALSIEVGVRAFVVALIAFIAVRSLTRLGGRSV